MARLSKEEHDRILESLATRGNADEEMMDLVGRLRADFDESLSVDVSETEREWERRYNDMRGERDRAIGERDESRRAYRERFFNGASDAQREAERIVDNQKQDSPRGMNALLGIEEEGDRI